MILPNTGEMRIIEYEEAQKIRLPIQQSFPNLQTKLDDEYDDIAKFRRVRLKYGRFRNRCRAYEVVGTNEPSYLGIVYVMTQMVKVK